MNELPIIQKTRMISAAPYRDRVVHHALCGIRLLRIPYQMISGQTFSAKLRSGLIG